MSVRVFDQSDRQFLAWSRANPAAFVANTTRGSRSRYFVLHRASCPQLSQYDSMRRPGGFTARSYIKIASDSLSEVREWGRRQRHVRPNAQTRHAMCMRRINQARVSPNGPDLLFPDEVEDTGVEGGRVQVWVNRYERDPKARRACILHFGCRCQVCDIDFEQVYGEIGRGFIHVHHLTPMSEITQRYKPDPRRHLRPVCPNCHAMLHRRAHVLSIDELRRVMSSRASNFSVQPPPRRRR